MTATNLLPAALCLVLSACSLPSGSEAEMPDNVREEPTAPIPGNIADGKPITSLGDLLGEYRVAGVDGSEVPHGEAIALSIDGPLMSFDPTCAGFVWEIGFEGDALVTRRSSNAADRPAGIPPPPVCAIAVSDGQRALAEALDAATRAERTLENAVRLSGGKHSVTLFSQ